MGTLTGAGFKFNNRHIALTRKLEAGRDIAQMYSSGLSKSRLDLDRGRTAMTHHIELYGKGSVGKTTLAANISAALRWGPGFKR
jgi:hypothetical protein